MEDYK
jgi:hypothetical protein